MKNLDSLFLKRREQAKLVKEIGDENLPDKQKASAEKRMDKLNAQSGGLIKKRGVLDRIHEIAITENDFRKLVPEIILRHKLNAEPGIILEQLDNDRRFVALPVETEDGKNFFLKIMKPKISEDDWERDFSSFIREIQTNQFLDKNCPELKALKIEHANIDMATIKQDFENNEIKYALIETLPEQKEIGFIHNHEQIKKLTPEHAKTCIANLLQQVESSGKAGSGFEQEIYDLQGNFDDYEGYKENTKKIMSLFEFEEDTDEKYENYVKPLDIKNILKYFKDKYPYEFNKLQVEVEDGKIDELEDDARLTGRFPGDMKFFPDRVPFWIVLEYRMHERGHEINFKEAVEELLDKWSAIMNDEKFQGRFMTHGDLSPNNMYVADNGKVRFLDREWTGVCGNKLLALVYDYGNLRARAWNNKEFREALDKKLKQELGEEAGSAVISLGILRSHCNLAGFFENYPLDEQEKNYQSQRRLGTEDDIIKAFIEAGIIR